MGSRLSFLILLAAVAFPVRAGEPGFAAKAVDLFDRPAAGAKVLARLAKQQTLEIVGRSGSWANVKSAGAAGWVRIADLRLNARAAQPAAASTRPRAATKDTGIRGFSEEELSVGSPNRAAADRLKRFAVTAKDAATFARSGNLGSRQRDYLEMQDYMPDGKLPEGFFDE